MTLRERLDQLDRHKKRKDRYNNKKYRLKDNNNKKLYPYYKRKFIPGKDKEL